MEYDNCDHEWTVNLRYQWRCRLCGLETEAITDCLQTGLIGDCINEIYPLDTYDLQQKSLNEYTYLDLTRQYGKGTYVWKYHFNERMAQANLTGPRVPENIVMWLTLYYHWAHKQGYVPEPEQLTKHDVGWICNNCPVPYEFITYYRSRSQNRNYLTKFSGYAERWYYLRYRFGAPGLPIPTEKELYTLRLNAMLAQQKWESVRHTTQCIVMAANTNQCHKTYACRKNFPHIYYIMNQICKLFHFEHLLPLFPVNNQAKTIERLNNFWEDICTGLQWRYHPMEVSQVVRKRKAQVKTNICHQQKTLYTMKRLKKKYKRQQISRNIQPLTHHKRTRVEVPLKKRNREKRRRIWVYDIGSYFSSLKME